MKVLPLTRPGTGFLEVVLLVALIAVTIGLYISTMSLIG